MEVRIKNNSEGVGKYKINTKCGYFSSGVIISTNVSVKVLVFEYYFE